MLAMPRPSYASIASVPVRRVPKPGEQRGSPRLVCGPGQVVALSARGETHLVPVHDMSDGGLMIQLPMPLAGGETVVIGVAGTQHAATVCWIEAGCAGLAFCD
jgi:hypothetical protein